VGGGVAGLKKSWLFGENWFGVTMSVNICLRPSRCKKFFGYNFETGYPKNNLCVDSSVSIHGFAEKST